MKSDFATPGVLVVAEGEAAAAGRAIVARAGARCLAAIPPARLAAALDRRARCDAILASLDRAEALDTLAAALAGRPAPPCVLAVPFALVDRGWALAGTVPLVLLCAPDPAERAAALAEALAAGGAAAVREPGGRPAELRRLSGEVARIARALEALASPVAEPPEPAEPMPAGMATEAPVPSAIAIRALLRARRLRDRFLDAALFADPAWDILLDLMAARIERRSVPVSSLCIAAAVPATTALRWIGGMTAAGLLERVPDPDDARRAFVALSSATAAAIAAYFAELAAQGLPGG